MCALSTRISMMSQGNAIVTDVTITRCPPAPLHVFEIWSNPAQVARRFEAAMGFALPPMGRAAGGAARTMIRCEPMVWLVTGDHAPLAAILAEDGALTPIDGGVVCFRLSGPGWRALLMEGGVFNAEDPAFGPGSSAATLIDHVNVRLHVQSDDVCDAYVPTSFSAALQHFWDEAAKTLAF